MSVPFRDINQNIAIEWRENTDHYIYLLLRALKWSVSSIGRNRVNVRVERQTFLFFERNLKIIFLFREGHHTFTMLQNISIFKMREFLKDHVTPKSEVMMLKI